MKQIFTAAAILLLPFGKAGMGFAQSSTGYYHSLALCNDSTVMAWGRNVNGQIGINSVVNPQPTPVQVLTGASGCSTYLCSIKAVAGGSNHSLALKSDGTVWTWGQNLYGQIGDNTTVDKLTPVQVLTGTSGCSTYLCSIKAIEGGIWHSLALKSDGTVWTWGRNLEGQLGDNTTVDKLTPVQVKTGTSGCSTYLCNIIAISSQANHCLALRSDSTVWAWGRNANGQLGDGTSTQRNTPVQVSGLTGIKAISTGENYSLALKSDSTVWAWGSNSISGCLGDNTITDRWTPVQVHGPGNVGFLDSIIAISGGNGYHPIALKSDGTVWTWGQNNNGQLGDNTNVDKWTPIQVLTGTSGCSTYLCNIKAVTGGYYHSLALKNDGTLWAWGWNNVGQLGDGTTLSKWTPRQSTPLCTVMPMPVEMLYFNAMVENNSSVRCEWSTATEINNDYFAVEQSKDGIVFKQIGTVKGAGNSSTALYYKFYDHEPYQGISYYRLRQVDYNWAFTYSEIRAVYIGTLGLISIYPNPSTDGSIQYIVASEDGGEVSVKVYDIIGRKVISNTEMLEGGVITKKLSTAALSSGSYLLQITNGNLEKTQKQFVIR